MTIFTFSEARQNFASVLDRAKKEGKVLIKRKDGSFFVIQPAPRKTSPLNVPGVNARLTRDDIIDTLREVRRR